MSVKERSLSWLQSRSEAEPEKGELVAGAIVTLLTSILIVLAEILSVIVRDGPEAQVAFGVTVIGILWLYFIYLYMLPSLAGAVLESLS